MADKTDITVTVEGKTLTRSLKNISDRLVAELQSAVKDLAYGAYAHIMANAQEHLGKTRQDYLKGLNIDQLGDNSYIISLKGEWPNKLEAGFAAYSIKDVLLNSKKIVGVGSRAGQTWVQKGKKGQRFAHVPIEHKPFSKEKHGADLNAALRKMTGFGVNGMTQRLTKIFKDMDGSAIQGKVATGRSDNPMLDQVVKYQKIYKNQKGKETVQSIYITYRTISDLSAGWQNPGFSGLKAFSEARKWVEKELDNVIKNLGR